MSRQVAAPGASDDVASALYALATGAVRRRPRDMSSTSAATLATLHRTGPRRITDLAVSEGVTQPAMTVLVRVMEESGLVERRRDASDKRVTLVWLTDAGASYVETRRRAGVDAFARLVDELGDDEVAALVAALPALARLAELDGRPRERQSSTSTGSRRRPVSSMGKRSSR